MKNEPNPSVTGAPNAAAVVSNAHLNALEAESIYIIREVIATAKNPALLFSGGKDSVVLFALACKAFRFGNRPLKLPFQLVHIDTGHNYPSAIKPLPKRG